MAYGYIYKIINLINGDIYIGQTTQTVEKRFNQHLYSSRYSYFKEYSYIHRAIAKYGKDNFVVITVCRANNQIELNHREAVCMKLYNTSYNIRYAGSRGKFSEESRKKLSIAKKGKKRGPHKPETVAKIVKANTGKKRSDITKEKMSKARRGTPAIQNYRQVSIINLLSGIVLDFKSITEASETLNIKRTCISNAKNGLAKTFGKYFQVVGA